MTEMAKKSFRSVQIVVLALISLSGVANAQEGEEALQPIQNVLLTFHLVQADGFTDDDPEISDVVTELRRLFNFRGYRLLSTSVFNVGVAPQAPGANTLRGSGSQRIIPVGSETPLIVQTDVTALSSATARTVRATVRLKEVTTRRFGVLEAETAQLPLLEASVTMRDGQRVVLGTAFRSADEPVLILIVTARIDPQS